MCHDLISFCVITFFFEYLMTKRTQINSAQYLQMQGTHGRQHFQSRPPNFYIGLMFTDSFRTPFRQIWVWGPDK